MTNNPFLKHVTLHPSRAMMSIASSNVVCANLTWTLASVALVLLLLPVQLTAQNTSHPSLLFNSSEIAALRKKVQRSPWRDQWQLLKAEFDKTLTTKVEVPPRGSNWLHWYVCPRHGVELQTGKQIAPWRWEHICPVDHEVFLGDPSRPDRDFDGSALHDVHLNLAEEIRTAGVLYQVTGDRRYAQRGREILMAYADHYLSYPLHTTLGEAKIGGGRVGPQTLDEAVWLIPVTQGADLIWNFLSDEDRKVVTNKLFLPAVRDVILPHHMGVHNIQCWKNSAVGLVGFLLDDQNFIDAAIDDPVSGYRKQMSDGVRDDGAWYEGAWSYHFYTLNALWPLTEAARNNGIDLYGESLKKMFGAPLEMAMPNLHLPAFNDSFETDVHNPLYELAYSRYHNPRYLNAINSSTRKSNLALWFGSSPLPPVQPLSPHGRNATASGYVVLQQGRGTDATWFALKYGPHGGAHGHPDKNTFVLYARGKVLMPDAGTRPYGSRLHAEWDRTTLAHNTLVVDHKSQNEATGKSLAFGSSGQAQYSMTDAGAIYPGVRFIRTVVLLNKNLAVFVDHVEADKQHTLNLACHFVGRWSDVPAGKPMTLSSSDGYQHLQDVLERQASSDVVLHLQVEPDWNSSIVLANNEPTQVITATGVGKDTADRIPAAIFSRVAAQSNFIWTVSLDGSPIKLRVGRDEGPMVDVRVGTRDDSWSLHVDAHQGRVEISTHKPGS